MIIDCESISATPATITLSKKMLDEECKRQNEIAEQRRLEDTLLTYELARFVYLYPWICRHGGRPHFHTPNGMIALVR